MDVKFTYLVIAYSVVYAAIAAYVLFLDRREAALRRDLDALRRARAAHAKDEV